MDIWKILGISRTADKKTIKRAYAAKTREIHPEEKPEEFKVLHEAYQAALEYAEFVSIGNIQSLFLNRDEFTDEDAEEENGESRDERDADERDVDERDVDERDTDERDIDEGSGQGEDELLTYFADNQEKQQKLVDVFIKNWQEFKGPYRNPEGMAWWREYLASEAFQNIKFHARILHVLAEEMEHKFFYGLDEAKMLFWDAYGFQDGEEENTFQGDRKRLYQCLHQAFVKQQKNVEDKARAARHEKKIHIFAGIAVAVFAVICITVPVNHYRQKGNDCRFLMDYMAGQYPYTSFSEPERQPNENNGSSSYTMYASAHPDLVITAKVEHRYVEGKKTRQVTEDYKQQLFAYYASQYGLDAGWTMDEEEPYGGRQQNIYNTLFYPDIEQIDSFCENVEKMFREQEELQMIPEVAVYTESVLFPQVLLYGSVFDFSSFDSQIYDLRAMEASELSAKLRNNYMIYMFQYESWNITTEQYREWGAEYEKFCERLVNDDGDWHEVYDPVTGKSLCRFYIPTYEYVEYYHGAIIPARWITVGNAYYFLKDREANLTVNEDGSGFAVKFYGSTTAFGKEPVVKFDDLRKCY